MDTRVGVPTKTEVMTVLPSNFFLVQGKSSQELQLNRGEKFLTVGKNLDASITVDDRELSNNHLKILKMKDEMLFLDRGKNDLCTFNGLKSRQYICTRKSRVVVELGKNCIVYGSRRIAANRKKSYLQYAEYRGTIFKTNEESILIGAHKICDLRIPNVNVADFSTLIFWKEDGPWIKRIGLSKAPSYVNDKKLTTELKLNESDIISFGNEQVRFYFDKALFINKSRGLLNEQNLALSTLNCHTNKTYKLGAMQSYTLGRGRDANMKFDDTSVSRIHALVKVFEKYINIKNVSVQNSVRVNADEYTRKTVLPGDIIELGDLALLLHYCP